MQGERRVALGPGHLPALLEAGFEVVVESGAGRGCGWSDEAYSDAGASLAPDRASLFRGARLVVAVRPPGIAELDGAEPGTLLVSFLSPGAEEGLLPALADRGIDAAALERVPRTTRAQSMDALSSQATAAGYTAVLLGAARLSRFLPMLTTAAGTIRPATVLVLGAGVAGLQAIATARRLGARVQGYDIRAAAAEQVQSLGATFLHADLPGDAEVEGGYARALGESESERQLAFLAQHVARADLVITTAQIPGRPAPLLITRAMVEAMAPGSVIVDLASETGGNCELSRPGESTRHGGVSIEAPIHPASGPAQHASEMLGRNVTALLVHLRDGEGGLRFDPSDPIIDAVLTVRGGRRRSPGDPE